jgi:V/A-type H+/Na+-transporting ATPase subunit I
MLLEGWVPEENESKLKDFLEASGVYYESDVPEENDDVPVKLKNNRFARLFEMIGELYSMPDYKELDLTPFFAPFFMLFFGFCLGDAGYGVLIVLGATLYKFKAKKEIKPLLSLVQFLGISTVIFGALTGTIFGINLIDTGYTITDQSIALYQQAHIPATIIEKLKALKDVTYNTKLIFKNEVIKQIGESDYHNFNMTILKYTKAKYDFLNSFRYLLLDPNKMFNLALILGGVQIIFGMIIKMAKQIIRSGVKYALSTMGWLILIIGSLIAFGLYKMNVISEDIVKPLIYVILAISGLGIFIFNDPKRNILINFGAGIWDSYGMITGILGDLLSYIRLFALGISSAILGFVFNSLAVNMSPDIPVVGQLVMVIILLIGHGINIFMASLGSFVHPLRLTFVEFYKNAGFEGGGKKYQPFSK